LLKNDTELESLINRRVYQNMADKDSEFPYIVFRWSTDYNSNQLIAPSTLYLDIWDYSQSPAGYLDVRKRVIELLDEECFYIEGVGSLRFFIQTSGNIAEDTENIWHHAMQFNVRSRQDKY